MHVYRFKIIHEYMPTKFQLTEIYFLKFFIYILVVEIHFCTLSEAMIVTSFILL